MKLDTDFIRDLVLPEIQAHRTSIVEVYNGIIYLAIHFGPESTHDIPDIVITYRNGTRNKVTIKNKHGTHCTWPWTSESLSLETNQIILALTANTHKSFSIGTK